MAAEFKVSVKLHVDASQYVAEFTQASQLAQSFAATLQAVGSQAAAGLAQTSAVADAIGTTLQTTGTQAAQAAKSLADLNQSTRETTQTQQQSRTVGEAFIQSLRAQIAVVGKSSEELLRMRAAHVGVAAEAAPLILQWENQRAAQLAAAEAARQEEAAQRAAAAEKQRDIAAADAFVESLRQQAATQGMSATELMRYRAGLMGVSGQAEQYIKSIEGSANVNRVGALSAKEHANAMRMLPMQMTDVVTSLASGMPVWMVAIQQGGQIKDSFHGVGNAARAMVGAISPTLILFGGLTAAMGAFALASYQGATENEQLAQALINTGNAIGLTVGGLQTYASQIAMVTGLQGEASETLATFVGVGFKGRDMLAQYAQTAIEWSRVSGEGVDKVAERFVFLEKDPLKAALKLNEGMNFLSAEVIRQVAHLERHGEKTKAAEIVMGEYNSALRQRTEDVRQSTNSMALAWDKLWLSVRKVWDEMRGPARENTTTQKISQVQADLQVARQKLSAAETHAFGGSRSAKAEEERLRGVVAALKSQEMALQATAAAEQKAADAAADKASKSQAAADFEAKYGRVLEKSLSLQEKLKIARKEGEEAGYSEAAIKRVLAHVTEEHNKGLSKGANAQKTYNRELEQQKSLIAELSGLSTTFFKDWESLNKQYAQGRISLVALEKAQASLLAKQPYATALAKEEEKITAARVKAYQEEVKAQEVLLKHRQDAADKAEEAVEKAKDEEAAHAMAAAAGITLAEATAKIALARAEASYQAALSAGAEGAMLLALQREIEARRELIDVMQLRGTREASEKANKEFEKDWEKTSETVGRTLQDYIMAGGKDGLTYVKRLASTLILRPTIEWGTAQLGLGSSNTGSTAAGAGNLASGAYNLISSGMNVAATAGKSLASSELLAKYGSEAVREVVGQFGAGMMNTASWSAASQAAAAGGAQLAGVIAGSALNAFAGYGISKMLSGGYSAGSWVNTVAGIASAIPGIGPIAGVVGGIVNRAFGRKLKDQGVEGQFGGDDGFTGSSYQYYKGGWFRSSKTTHGELDEDLRQGLATQFDAMRAGTAAMADALGLGTAAVNSFTAGIKVSFNGLDEAGVQKALAEEFDKIAESMASATLGTTDYTRTGETAVEAITRLSGSLTTVNSVLGNLNSTLYASSLAGADMSSQLVDLFGGLDQFGTATAEYFKNFYGAQEQREAARRELQRQLDTVHLSLPDIDTADARTQWRELTDAQDLTTESGRKAWATLMQLSGTFAGLTQDAAAADDSMRKAMASLNDERRKLQADLLRAAGDDAGYAAAQRAMATEGYDDATRAAWDYNEALRQQIARLDEAAKLEQSLASLTGSAQQSALDVLQQLMERVSATSSYRTSLGSSIESARLGTMDTAGQAAYLRQKESGLWGQLNSAADPVAVAQQLQQTILDRISAEAKLRGDVEQQTLGSLQQQLSIAQSLKSAVDSMQSARDSLALGNTSALNPYDQLQYAGNKFDAAYQRALAGDVNAWRDVQSFGQSYVGLGRDVYASSTDSAGIYARVTEAMEQLIGMGMDADPQITALNTQIDLLKSVGDNTEQATWTAQQQLDSFMRLDDVMREQQDKQQQQLDKQLLLAQQQIDELRAQNGLLQAQIEQQAAIERARAERDKKQLAAAERAADSARMQEAQA